MITGILIAIVASSSWGVGNIFARVGLHVVKPSTATLLSLCATALVVVVGAAAVDRGALFSTSAGAVLWFGLVGILNFPLGRYFSYQGIRYIGVSRATIARGTAPLFTLILSVLLVNETVTPVVALGVFLIVGGLFLVVSE